MFILAFRDICLCFTQMYGGLFLLSYSVVVDVGDLKKQCETILGVVSQCYLTKHAYKMSKQYLVNVALKINVKVHCL